MVSVNIRMTLAQLATLDELRGRVSAVNSLFIATSNEAGDFRGGATAAVIAPLPPRLSAPDWRLQLRYGVTKPSRHFQARPRR